MNPDIVAGLMIGGYIFSMAVMVLNYDKPARPTTPVSLLFTLVISALFIAGTIYLYQT